VLTPSGVRYFLNPAACPEGRAFWQRIGVAPRDLFRAQDHRDFARLAHEGEVSCQLRAVERHGEEEAQRRNRAVDARRAHAGLRLMQLKAAKVLRRGTASGRGKL
jgi:hypothetical protein